MNKSVKIGLGIFLATIILVVVLIAIIIVIVLLKRNKKVSSENTFENISRNYQNKNNITDGLGQLVDTATEFMFPHKRKYKRKILRYYDSKREKVKNLMKNYPQLPIQYIDINESGPHGKVMDGVASVTFINLIRRPDRKLSFMMNSPWYVEGIFRATDYKELYTADDHPAIRQIINFQNNDFRNAKPIIACAVSHFRVWETVVEKDQIVAVFEDDALFYQDATQIWDQSWKHLPKDFDIIYLGQGGKDPYEDEKFSEKILKMKPNQPNAAFWSIKGIPSSYHLFFTALGIIYSPKGAQKLINFAKRDKMSRSLDWFISQYWHQLDVYAIKNWVTFTTTFVDSDIQHIYEPLSF